MTIFPAEVLRILKQIPDSHRYGQLATIDESGHPQNRTVCWHIKEDKLYVASGRQYAKISHIEKNETIAGCLFDPSQMIQLRWLGTAQVEPAGSALSLRVWQETREEIRQIYWNGSEQSTPADLSEYCPDFAILQFFPRSWKIDYLDEVTWVYRSLLIEWKAGAWQEQVLQPTLVSIRKTPKPD